MNCADTIKEIRKLLSISQEDLARELGVSFATVNRWENRKAKPSKMAMKSIEGFCTAKNIQLTIQGGGLIENKVDNTQ